MEKKLIASILVTIAVAVFAVPFVFAKAGINIGPFIPSPPATTVSWQIGTPYPIPISEEMCRAMNHYIYCTGGQDSSNHSIFNSYYAPIAKNGSIGSWAATTPLPSSINEQYCAYSVETNTVFCVGGNANHAKTSDVIYASLSASGIGTWHNTTSFPERVADISCAVRQYDIYCIARKNESSLTTDTFYAPISSSGVGTWSKTTSYPSPLREITCYATKNAYLYCVGGANDEHHTNEVLSAPITTGGIGAWTTQTPYDRGVHEIACTMSDQTPNATMFCIGGSEGKPSTSAKVAFTTSTGTLPGWNSMPDYPNQISVEKCTVYNNFLYCVGGRAGHPISSSIDSVYYLNVTNSSDYIV